MMEERDRPTVLRDGEFAPADAGVALPDFAPPAKYALVRCLGRGGFGAVYLARDRDLQRDVALKVLTHALPSDVERFRREARFTARLDDPAVVKVYEFGESDRRPYLAMQYVDGGNLLDAELDLAGLVAVVRAVALALQHAHAQGIVHRDIKPQNVLLDRSGRAYVADFGVARDVSGASGASLTGEGSIVGTPALMPPEQARGETRAIDARSDVYSLGATLFWKLTGRMPFVAHDLVDLLHAVVYDPPPFPRSLNPAIPRGLEAICLRCLAKRREERYSTMADLAADLGRFLAGDAIPAEGGAWFRKLVGVPPPPPPVDETPSSDPHLPAVLEVAREIAAWDANLYRVSANVTRTFARLDSLVARLDAVLAVRPDHAPARFTRGLALFRRDRLGEALEDLERAVDRVPDRARAQFELGRLYLALYLREHHAAHRHLSRVGVDQHLAQVKGRLRQAVLAFQEAQRLDGDLLPWEPDYAAAVERLAERDHAGCVAACDRILARDPDVEEVWKLRGDALAFSGKEPWESYDRALQVRRSYCDALLAKAEAYLAARRFREARESLARALEVRPDCVTAMALLGRACAREAEAGGGAALGTEALDWLDRAVAADPGHYEATVTRAELLIELGRLPGDPERVRQAAGVLERAKGLPGCQNRVQLLAARARLELARHAAARGEDARPELEAIVRLAEGEGAQVPDNAPWRAVLEAARRELGMRGG